MSGWNYRVFKRIHNHKYLHEPETLYEIREAFYDDSGKVNGWAEMPDVIADSLDGLKWTLSKMMEGCDKPIIDDNTKEELN
jgi:hypothetical protein